MHVSAIMYILPGYGVLIFGRDVLSGHCNQQQISVKLKGYLFSEGYLFTGFYGTCIVSGGTGTLPIGESSSGMRLSACAFWCLLRALWRNSYK